MKYFSLFSGIGGFELGIGDAECIGYSEIDRYAIQVYERHFSHRNYGDAAKINTEKLPNFDLLVAGFPCQAFSIAGKRRGFDDTRGTLFFEIARILGDKRPRYFLLENVKGLLSHEEGKTFQTILKVLTDLGYGIEWQVLNSKNHGVPQNRERVFIIGDSGEGSGSKIFPLGESNKKNNGNVKDISSALDANYWKGPSRGFGGRARQMIELTKDVSDAQRVYDSNGLAKTLKGLGGGMGAKTGLYALRWSRTEKGKKVRREAMKKGKDYTPFNKGHRELTKAKEQVTGAVTHAVNKDSLLGVKVAKAGTKIRRLTPTECERLQGFPDGWTEGISDTQRYKCLGNAVTVNVAQAIFEKWQKCGKNVGL